MAQKRGLLSQIKDLEISAMDDVSSCAPDSTFNNPYRSQALASRKAGDGLHRQSSNRQSFVNFNASGRKSPINRTHINRMTQNLVANNKSYLNRRSTIIQPVHHPIPLRDMWKIQDQNDDDDDEQEQAAKKKAADKTWFKTTVKFEKDMEIFETEELGSDEEEREETDSLSDDSVVSGDGSVRQVKTKKPKIPTKRADLEPAPLKKQVPDYGNLRVGVDIIDEDVSTDRAYTVFRELERDEAMREFKPPRLAETGGLAGVGDSRFAQEIPSERIARLQKELESLQQELVGLEKDEMPSRKERQAQSAKQSLKQIDELRNYMHKVVGSSQFQDLETRQNLDINQILEHAYSKQHVSTGAEGEAAAKGKTGNTQDLKQALQQLLSGNVSKMDSSEVIKGADINNEIELFVRVDQTPDEIQKFKNELIAEQHKRYLALQTDLEECERVVGPWNPANKFSSIYDALDNVHDEIEEFNNNEDAKVAPTPSNSVVPATPGGSRRSTISAKAKQFNADLYTLQQKFQTMEDVAYDQQKVDHVFQMTERALEQKSHLDIVIQRLDVLEGIHKESPTLETRLKRIVQRATQDVPAALIRETEQAAEARKEIISAAGELDQFV